jgi:hypothetical protein
VLSILWTNRCQLFYDALLRTVCNLLS